MGSPCGPSTCRSSQSRESIRTVCPSSTTIHGGLVDDEAPIPLEGDPLRSKPLPGAERPWTTKQKATPMTRGRCLGVESLLQDGIISPQDTPNRINRADLHVEHLPFPDSQGSVRISPTRDQDRFVHVPVVVPMGIRRISERGCIGRVEKRWNVELGPREDER